MERNRALIYGLIILTIIGVVGIVVLKIGLQKSLEMQSAPTAKSILEVSNNDVINKKEQTKNIKEQNNNNIKQANNISTQINVNQNQINNKKLISLDINSADPRLNRIVEIFNNFYSSEIQGMGYIANATVNSNKISVFSSGGRIKLYCRI